MIAAYASIYSDPFVTIRYSDGKVVVKSYQSEQHAVYELINSGELALAGANRSRHWGSPEHREAVELILRRAQEVLHVIDTLEGERE